MPHTYSPARRCIYCGSSHFRKGDTSQKLGDEHIIPLSWGGDLLLPEASCEKCGAATSGVESKCTNNMLDAARHPLGLTARRNKRPRRTLPVYRAGKPHPTAQSVPVNQHPTTLIMFAFPGPPEILLGLPPREQFAGKIVIKPLVPDIGHRADRLGGQVSLTRGFEAEPFARMLAKIAHAYVVAELGLGAFRPFLFDLIKGKLPLYPSQFVGGSFVEEPASSNRHELSWRDVRRSDGRAFIEVRIRLFAEHGMPVHYVVVGERVPAQDGISTSPANTAALA